MLCGKEVVARRSSLHEKEGSCDSWLALLTKIDGSPQKLECVKITGFTVNAPIMSGPSSGARSLAVTLGRFVRSVQAFRRSLDGKGPPQPRDSAADFNVDYGRPPNAATRRNDVGSSRDDGRPPRDLSPTNTPSRDRDRAPPERTRALTPPPPSPPPLERRTAPPERRGSDSCRSQHDNGRALVASSRGAEDENSPISLAALNRREEEFQAAFASLKSRIRDVENDLVSMRIPQQQQQPPPPAAPRAARRSEGEGAAEARLLAAAETATTSGTLPTAPRGLSAQQSQLLSSGGGGGGGNSGSGTARGVQSPTGISPYAKRILSSLTSAGYASLPTAAGPTPEVSVRPLMTPRQRPTAAGPGDPAYLC